MEVLMSFVVGVMVAASVYLLLSHNAVRALFGIILLSNAANFVIFASGRLTEGSPPLIPEGMESLPGDFSNPLPQALILTAIVIGFGLLAFALVLVYRGYQELGTINTDHMRTAEPLYPGEELPPGDPREETTYAAAHADDPAPERSGG